MTAKAGAVQTVRFLHRDREAERRSVAGGGVGVAIDRLVRHELPAEVGVPLSVRVAAVNSPGTVGARGVGQGAVAAAGLRERQRADCLAFRVGLVGYRDGEGRGSVRRPSRSGSTRTLGAKRR